MENLIRTRIQESIDIKNNLLSNENLIRSISALSDEIVNCIDGGGKIVLCGNGGSASDALHFAGEIVGRFQRERSAWPALVLNADVATMTAIANDYGYDDVFARQTEGHINESDIFLGISTSGNSQNICKAVKIAHNKGAKTAALLGRDGGKLLGLADYPLVVPCSVTARIQECHILIIHIICEIVEGRLCGK